jgi:hypothetical protein
MERMENHSTTRLLEKIMNLNPKIEFIKGRHASHDGKFVVRIQTWTRQMETQDTIA